MSENIPSFDDYHQAQIIKTFRAIGRFLLDGLIEAGKCLSLTAPDIAAPVANAITDEEISNFVWRSGTFEFDVAREALIRDNPID